jgi:hypothetical protein
MMKPLSDKKLAMKANVQAMRDRAAAKKQKAADWRAGSRARREERLAALGKTLPQKKPFIVDDTGMKGQSLYERPINDMNRIETYNKGGVVKKSKGSMDYRKSGTTLSTKDNRKKK